MRVALQVRAARPAAEQFSKRLADELQAAGVVVSTEPGVAADLVIAVGGDGTMLAAVQDALQWDVPVVGFNLGTLGFLTAAEPGDLTTVVRRLVGGDYEVDERLTVTAAVGGNSARGVNDVVVEKVDSTRLVSLSVVIDGIEFTTYRADGLIIATPTGSTAYAFSAGGPIVDPDVEALVLIPVASHALFDRSIVLPPDSRIDVTVATDRAVRVNVDKSDLGEIGDGDTVEVRAGERPARFVSFGGSPFPRLVREKFGLS